MHTECGGQAVSMKLDDLISEGPSETARPMSFLSEAKVRSQIPTGRYEDIRFLRPFTPFRVTVSVQGENANFWCRASSRRSVLWRPASFDGQGRNLNIDRLGEGESDGRPALQAVLQDADHPSSLRDRG